ncbi:MAG: hypothetical protein ABZF75_00425, partial [Columbia Basin potato purple top phytoplasma]
MDEDVKTLTDIIAKIKTLQNELTNNPQLPPNTKTQKQQELTELKNQQQKQQTLVNNLIEQRKALNQNQKEKQEIDNQIKLEQARIQELQQLQEQDHQLKTQIDENVKTLTETIVKIKTLQTELTNNPQLDPTIKTQKQQELTELKNQQQKQQTLVNNLIEQRKALNQNQQEKKAALEKLAQEKAQLQTQENLQQQIFQFQQAINYVAANQKNLEELKNRKENRENQTELKKLNGFNLFLEGQKLYFNKQKNNLQTQLNHLKENKPLPHTKKQVTFKDVYGMETEKEELEDLLTYFKTNQTLINFDQVRPKGYLLYGPPGTG